jgi:two-component system chemotaxis response regulator CheB
MPVSKIVVVGASSGGIEALCELLAGLPSDFRTPVFVVQHIGRTESILPTILSRCGPLEAAHPRHREPIRPSRVYVAPANQHLVIRDGHVELLHDPRENRSRPAVDPLFRSAARAYREKVIGIILSGELDDGVAGLFAIKARGGVAIVQDPQDAQAPSMPSHALRSVSVDHVLPVTQMAALLAKLTEEKSMPTKKGKKKSARGRSKRVTTTDELDNDVGTAVPMACPDCSGPLLEVKNGKVIRFHCIVGHSFSPVSLSDAHADALERALWVALRTLKERLTLQRALVERHTNKQENELARRIAEDAEAIQRDIRLLTQIQERI